MTGIEMFGAVGIALLVALTGWLLLALYLGWREEQR